MPASYLLHGVDAAGAAALVVCAVVFTGERELCELCVLWYYRWMKNFRTPSCHVVGAAAMLRAPDSVVSSSSYGAHHSADVFFACVLACIRACVRVCVAACQR